MTSIDPSVLRSMATAPSSPSDPLSVALERFEATGAVDIAVFGAAGPEALDRALRGLPPRQQGDLQRRLADNGLHGGLHWGLHGGLVGGLVGATVEGVGQTVARTTDAAIETRTERQAQEASDRIESSRLDRWMGEVRGQADIDFVLAPLSKQDRPPAALASGVRTGSIEDGQQP
jgi:hypothetical protein